MLRESAEARIRDFIDHTTLRGQGADVTATTPLLDLGILDSFAILVLVGFLEEEFHLMLSLNEIADEDLESVRSLATLVAHRMLP